MTEKPARLYAWNILVEHKTAEAREKAILETVPEEMQKWVRFYVDTWPKQMEVRRKIKRDRE